MMNMYLYLRHIIQMNTDTDNPKLEITWDVGLSQAAFGKFGKAHDVCSLPFAKYGFETVAITKYSAKMRKSE